MLPLVIFDLCDLLVKVFQNARVLRFLLGLEIVHLLLPSLLAELQVLANETREIRWQRSCQGNADCKGEDRWHIQKPGQDRRHDKSAGSDAAKAMLKANDKNAGTDRSQGKVDDTRNPPAAMLPRQC